MIQDIVLEQRRYFNIGETLTYDFRKKALIKLREQLILYKDKLVDAFVKDFNKGEFDVVATEFGLVIMEIDYMLKHLKKLMKPKKVKTGLINFPSHGFIVSEPYGVVLVMSPWNYPLQLSIMPLVASIASGNTTILKPSQYSYNVSLVMKEMLSCFSEKFIYVALGGREVNTELLDQKFDYIFFTGGTTVGKLVMEKASKHLTPISLELGGKSPCIITKSANLKLASKRLAWGKFLNAGQTCVAPDYVLIDESIKDEFIKLLIEEVKKQHYNNGILRSDFCHIINDKHVNRLTSLIEAQKVVFGGKIAGRLIEPTIMDNVSYDDKVMQEEIFGPILPIITYSSIDDVIDDLKIKEKPLALYLFTENNKEKNRILTEVSFGGGCINDTVMHLTTHNLPFGGVGNSGMGSYHGKKSFETFSHQKSILVKGKAELNTKYSPYKKKNLKLIERIGKIK